MAFTIILIEEAENELDESFIWYESQKIGLGLEFVNHIEKAFEFIKNNPKLSAKKTKNVYRFVMKKFPFGIYYTIDITLSQIHVIGILHFRRKPSIWKKRIRG
jgi:toxin ParE1/3/4